jgi:hypothetical protein
MSSPRAGHVNYPHWQLRSTSCFCQFLCSQILKLLNTVTRASTAHFKFKKNILTFYASPLPSGAAPNLNLRRKWKNLALMLLTRTFPRHIPIHPRWHSPGLAELYGLPDLYQLALLHTFASHALRWRTAGAVAWTIFGRPRVNGGRQCLLPP